MSSGPFIQADRRGPDTLIDGAVQDTRDALAGKRCIGFQRYTLARKVVHHREHAQSAAVGECITDEVQRPLLVGVVKTG